MICPNCGEEINDDSKFCFLCGEAITDQTDSSKDYDSEKVNLDSNTLEKDVSGKEKNLTLKYSLFIVIVILVFLIAVFIQDTANNNITKFEAALNADEINTSIDLFYIMTDEDRVEARRLARSYANQIYDEYFNEIDGKDYVSVKNSLDKVYENILCDDEEISLLLDSIDEINESRIAYSTAESFYNEGNLIKAIPEYNKVIIEDTAYYNKVQDMLPKMINTLKESTLEEATEYINDFKLEEAKIVLSQALSVIPGDEELQVELNIVENAMEEAGISEVLDKADQCIANGEFQLGIEILTDALSKYPDEISINSKLEILRDKYKQSQLELLPNYYANEDFTGAILMLQQMKEYIPSDTDIDDLILEYQSYIPTSLTELSTSEKASVYSSGQSLSDNFGNDYANSFCLEAEKSAFEGSSDNVGVLVYLINGNYNRISGNLAYWRDAYSTYHRGQSHLEIYADDLLVYTSPQITDDSTPISFDVSLGENCHKLKIRLAPENVYTSYVILGDAQIYNR